MRGFCVGVGVGCGVGGWVGGVRFGSPAWLDWLCRYSEAAQLLELERQNFPRSRAALSLLAYCYYYMQDFRSAADVRVEGSHWWETWHDMLIFTGVRDPHQVPPRQH